MPLQDDHQIVSVDDHLVEHPRVWQDRLPRQFLEAGPRIVEEDGKHLWISTRVFSASCQRVESARQRSLACSATKGPRAQRPRDRRRVAGCTGALTLATFHPERFSYAGSMSGWDFGRSLEKSRGRRSDACLLWRIGRRRVHAP